MNKVTYGLTASKANSNIALESYIVWAGEFESIKFCSEWLRFRIMLPFAKYRWIRSAAILVSHYVLIFDIVVQRFGNTAPGKAAINTCNLGKFHGLVKIKTSLARLIGYSQFFNLLVGWTSTCSTKFSPISAEFTSRPESVTIFIIQVGGGPVLAMVPAVVNIDTLKPIVTFCSLVVYTHLMW